MRELDAITLNHCVNRNRSVHTAGLNFGDCFAYDTAMAHNPLHWRRCYKNRHQERPVTVPSR
jgi:hypothetical protein